MCTSPCGGRALFATLCPRLVLPAMCCHGGAVTVARELCVVRVLRPSASAHSLTMSRVPRSIADHRTTTVRYMAT